MIPSDEVIAEAEMDVVLPISQEDMEKLILWHWGELGTLPEHLHQYIEEDGEPLPHGNVSLNEAGLELVEPFTLQRAIRIGTPVTSVDPIGGKRIVHQPGEIFPLFFISPRKTDKFPFHIVMDGRIQNIGRNSAHSLLWRVVEKPPAPEDDEAVF